jgi:hypothetical protein
MFIVVWFVFIIYCLINAPERCAGITQPIYGHEVGCDKDYGLAMLNAIFPTILFFLLYIFVLSVWYNIVEKPK